MAEKPFGNEIEINSYSDYCKFIKGHTAKSLQSLYDETYYAKHVGNKNTADSYFKSKGLETTRYTKIPIELAQIKKGEKVLDIGCGRGEVVFQTANLGAISTGIDYSESAINFAQKTRELHENEIKSRTNFICVNAEKLDFTDKTFDKIFLLDVVEHISKNELYTILREARRVLKKDGKLIIHSTPNVWSRTYGYWLGGIFTLLKTGKMPVHPVVEQFQALKKDPDLETDKLFLHINEQSIPSMKIALISCGLQSKVWLKNSGNPFAMRTDFFGKIGFKLFVFLGLKLIFGSDIFAVASPKN
ncbi:class I SAM-dependent methyltransferase [bacterium]|nr:class I SAM-dependent methyltransferase [bacterium]